MNGVEIILITSMILLFIMWVWFIVLGFRTSRLWGAALVFFFPISPFLFAYRFERKTRQAIYYFVGVLAFFMLILVYIHFATSVDFYETFSHKVAKAMPRIDFSNKPKQVKNLNLPPPAFIPPPLTDVPTKTVTTPEVTKAPDLPSAQTRGYKTMDVGSINNYVGKKVIITTATVVHKGKLISVSGNQIEIKKSMGSGSTIMSVPKNNIEKFEVYL